MVAGPGPSDRGREVGRWPAWCAGYRFPTL